MNNNTLSIATPRTIITDIGVLLAIYLVPGLSHLVEVPLYYFDPMRFFLLLGFFLTANRNNALLLAVTIPLFSWLVSGHPILLKAFLISVELLTNVLILSYLVKSTKLSLFFSLIISIFLSKIAYYFLKFVVIQTGLLDMELIATDLLIQLGVLVFLSVVFYLFFRKSIHSRN
jgi:hypothetical protein